MNQGLPYRARFRIEKDCQVEILRNRPTSGHDTIEVRAPDIETARELANALYAASVELANQIVDARNPGEWRKK